MDTLIPGRWATTPIYNVVLEGPDGLGKSTVSKLLEGLLGRVETRHCIPASLGRNELIGLDFTYWELNQQAKRFSILDRWYGTSEWVYNPQANAEEIDDLLYQLKVHRTLIVVVITAEDDETIRQRVGARGDEYYSIEQIVRYNKRYKLVAQTMLKHNVPVLWFNLSSADAARDDISMDIAKRIQEQMVAGLLDLEKKNDKLKEGKNNGKEQVYSFI